MERDVGVLDTYVWYSSHLEGVKPLVQAGAIVAGGRSFHIFSFSPMIVPYICR